jgi:CheY-like chemotaxis protein
MPEMNGLEAIAKLEESPEWADIPVVFFTSMTDEEYIGQCLETGAKDIIIKPFNDDKFLEIVKQNVS